MSLFGSLMLGGFDDDPFFGGHRSMMRHMDQMMSSMLRDPFESDPFFAGGSPFPALTHHPHTAAVQGRHHQRPRPPQNPFCALAIPSMSNLMTPVVPLVSPIQHPQQSVIQHPQQSVIQHPQQSVDQMAQPGNCHMFSSSSVMTMTTGPDGRPQVYQASTSSRDAPGGVRETRRTVHDGRSGTRKMAIGHHIGERSHIIEREHAAGNMEERQEFVNLEEEEAVQFDHEFRRRTTGSDPASLEYRPRHRNSNLSHRPRSSNLPAITSSSYRRRSRPMLSITAGPSEDRGRRDREERRQRFK